VQPISCLKPFLGHRRFIEVTRAKEHAIHCPIHPGVDEADRKSEDQRDGEVHRDASRAAVLLHEG
jgi:hypothetical protein